jgi:cation diffusion facilitator family transporter
MRDYAGIRRVLIVTMVLNWLATAAQLYAGLLSGTLSLTANGLDSLLDGFSNVAGLVAISVAAQPPDREHPYGHRKYETMVALGIAMSLGIITWELVMEALQRFRQPEMTQITTLTFAALIFGIGMQGIAAVYEFRESRRLHSELLLADARHTAGSIVLSVAVLLGLPFEQAGYLWVDPALTLVVAAVIAKLGWDILRDSFPVLVDRAPLDPDQIGRVVGNVAGVTSYHRIRSRGAADAASVDLHVRVGPDLPMARADAIADQVRDRLLNEVTGISDVTVHVEPQRQNEATASEIYAAILNAAAGYPITVHEVWAYQESDGQTRAEAHIGVPPYLTLEEADRIVSLVEASVLVQVPWVQGLHTHIEPAFRSLVPGALVPAVQVLPIQSAVVEAVSEVPELSQPSNLRVYSTAEGLFLAVDCIARPELTVNASHILAHAVAQGIRERVPQVVDVAVRVKPPERPPVREQEPTAAN